MSNYDYPEPFEVSSARNMENITRFHAREQGTQRPHLPSDNDTDSSKVLLQANAPAVAQPERAQYPTYNSPPQSQHTQPGDFNHTNAGRCQLQIQQAPTGSLGYEQPAPQAQQGGYSYAQRHSYSPSPSPDFSPGPPSATYTRPPRRSRGDGSRPREITYLQPGFAWNRESLALLCKSKEKGKKGFKLIASTGKFPGKTEKELQDTWTARKVEARAYYKEVYKKSDQD